MAVGMVPSPNASVGAWRRRNEEKSFSVKPAVSEEWGVELARTGSGGLREGGEGGQKPRRKKRRQRNKGMRRVGIS